MSASPPLPSQGDLRRVPTAQLLWDLCTRRFTGTLVVRGGDDAGVLQGESAFALDRGRLTQARLAQPLDTLGFVLHEQGAITGAQLDASLMKLASGKGLQGEILVAMGACDRAAVDEALREQLRRKALRLFALSSGTFELHEGRDLLQGFGRERPLVELMPLLWVGARAHPRHPTVDLVIARLGPQALRLRPGSPARECFALEPEERALVDRLAAGATVPELAAGSPNVLTVRALVYLLAMARQLERAPASTPAPSSDDPRPSQMAIPAVHAAELSTPPVHPAGPPRRISSSNLPTVVGPSMAPIARDAQASQSAALGHARERLAEAEARLALMDRQTAFEMLGVTSDAPVSVVRAAFRGLAVRWHPEAAPASLLALRELHEKIFAMLSEAESTLTDARSREVYLSDVALGFGTPYARRTRSPRRPDLARAEQALRLQSYAEAERAARAALAEAPDDPSALVLLATALLEQSASGPYEEVKRCLAAALKKDPRNDRAIVVAAQLQKRLGDEERALVYFAKAYRLNPRNVDAVRELRLYAMRKRDKPPEDAEVRGLLARLFGKT